MTRLDNPRQVPLRLVRQPQAIDPSLVCAQPSLLNAVKLCIASAGFEKEKQVYDELEIDAGHWTRITRGDAHFPLEKLGELMDLCGNEAPLLWLLHSRGYDLGSLRKRESETESALRIARERIAELEREAEVITRFVGKARVTS